VGVRCHVTLTTRHSGRLMMMMITAGMERNTWGGGKPKRGNGMLV